MKLPVKIAFFLCFCCGWIVTTYADVVSDPQHVHPATNVLREFLVLVSKEELPKAFSLVSTSAKTVEDATIKGGPVTWEQFRDELTADRSRLAPLIAEVDAIERNRELARKDWPDLMDQKHPRFQLHALKTRIRRIEKCNNFQFGKPESITARKIKIPLTTTEGSLVDNDVAILVEEDGRWRLANPIHVIR